MRRKRHTGLGGLCSVAQHVGPIDQSLKDALVQRGLVDGGNIEIIYRYANGSAGASPAELASELVAQKPDMLLAVGGDVIKALFDATRAASRSLAASATARCGRESPRLSPGRARISPVLRS